MVFLFLVHFVLVILRTNVITVDFLATQVERLVQCISERSVGFVIERLTSILSFFRQRRTALTEALIRELRREISQLETDKREQANQLKKRAVSTGWQSFGLFRRRRTRSRENSTQTEGVDSRRVIQDLRKEVSKQEAENREKEIKLQEGRKRIERSAAQIFPMVVHQVVSKNRLGKAREDEKVAKDEAGDLRDKRKKDIEDREVELKILRSRLHNEEECLKMSSKSYENLRSTKRKLTKTNEGLEKETTTLKREKEDLEVENENLKDENKEPEALRKEIEGLKLEISGLRKELEENNTEYANSVQGHELEMKNLQGKMDDLQPKLIDLDYLRRQSSTESWEIGQLSKRIRDLERQNHGHIDNADQLRRQLATAEHKTNEWREAWRRDCEEFNQLRAEVNSDSTVNWVELEITKLKVSQGILRSGNAALRDEETALRERLAAHTTGSTDHTQGNDRTNEGDVGIHDMGERPQDPQPVHEERAPEEAAQEQPQPTQDPSKTPPPEGALSSGGSPDKVPPKEPSQSELTTKEAPADATTLREDPTSEPPPSEPVHKQASDSEPGEDNPSGTPKAPGDGDAADKSGSSSSDDSDSDNDLGGTISKADKGKGLATVEESANPKINAIDDAEGYESFEADYQASLAEAMRLSRLEWDRGEGAASIEGPSRLQGEFYPEMAEAIRQPLLGKNLGEKAIGIAGPSGCPGEHDGDIAEAVQQSLPVNKPVPVNEPVDDLAVRVKSFNLVPQEEEQDPTTPKAQAQQRSDDSEMSVQQLPRQELKEGQELHKASHAVENVLAVSQSVAERQDGDSAPTKEALPAISQDDAAAQSVEQGHEGVQQAGGHNEGPTIHVKMFGEEEEDPFAGLAKLDDQAFQAEAESMQSNPSWIQGLLEEAAQSGHISTFSHERGEKNVGTVDDIPAATADVDMHAEETRFAPPTSLEDEKLNVGMRSLLSDCVGKGQGAEQRSEIQEQPEDTMVFDEQGVQHNLGGIGESPVTAVDVHMEDGEHAPPQTIWHKQPQVAAGSVEQVQEQMDTEKGFEDRGEATESARGADPASQSTNVRHSHPAVAPQDSSSLGRPLFDIGALPLPSMTSPLQPATNAIAVDHASAPTFSFADTGALNQFQNSGPDRPALPLHATTSPVQQASNGTAVDQTFAPIFSFADNGVPSSFQNPDPSRAATNQASTPPFSFVDTNAPIPFQIPGSSAATDQAPAQPPMSSLGAVHASPTLPDPQAASIDIGSGTTARPPVSPSADVSTVGRPQNSDQPDRVEGDFGSVDSDGCDSLDRALLGEEDSQPEGDEEEADEGGADDTARVEERNADDPAANASPSGVPPTSGDALSAVGLTVANLSNILAKSEQAMPIASPPMSSPPPAAPCTESSPLSSAPPSDPEAEELLRSARLDPSSAYTEKNFISPPIIERPAPELVEESSTREAQRALDERHERENRIPEREEPSQEDLERIRKRKMFTLKPLKRKGKSSNQTSSTTSTPTVAPESSSQQMAVARDNRITQGPVLGVSPAASFQIPGLSTIQEQPGEPEHHPLTQQTPSQHDNQAAATAPTEAPEVPIAPVSPASSVYSFDSLFDEK